VIPERVLQPPLARLAKAIVDRHRPLVVAVSGSVGKTSAKDAVSCVLGEWKHTQSSPGNQNDELGVPLSIIGAAPSGRNLLGWLATLRRARRMLRSREGSYPDCLVLEFGSCHPGDVEYLMRMTTPRVGLLTAVEPTHLEFYGSVEAIALEEGKVVTMLPAGGAGIVNADNASGRAAIHAASCPITTYGFAATADVRGLRVASSIDWRRRVGFTDLELRCGQERATVRIQGTLGSHSCYAPLAAIGVAQAVGIPFRRAVDALRRYVTPAGRMQCRAGRSGSLVVDDTYNSSPAAVLRALETLAGTASRSDHSRAIAVLGPMAELGPSSRVRHEAVGRFAAELGLHRLVTVGEEAGAAAGAARGAGMPADRVLELAGPEEAIRVLTERARPGDVVLVKGSQSSRLARVTEALADRAQMPLRLPPSTA
jgi:UDP-N-acetylmuramoyl-tripeptide--D-alanyl-D-alanine ligase